jgi:hypothetical protein
MTGQNPSPPVLFHVVRGNLPDSGLKDIEVVFDKVD